MATIAVSLKVSENRYAILTMPEFIKVFGILGGFSDSSCQEQFMNCSDNKTYTIAELVDILAQNKYKEDLVKLKSTQRKIIDEPYEYDYGQVVMCRESNSESWVPTFYLGASVVEGMLFHYCVSPDYIEQYMSDEPFLAKSYMHVRKVYSVDKEIATLYTGLEVGTNHEDYVYRLMYEPIKEVQYGI
jgi:hypothetical protein